MQCSQSVDKLYNEMLCMQMCIFEQLSVKPNQTSHHRHICNVFCNLILCDSYLWKYTIITNALKSLVAHLDIKQNKNLRLIKLGST